MSCVVLSGIHVGAQVPPLRLRVSVGMYCGEAYTLPPQGGPTFLYIAGEPIGLRLTVGNYDLATQHQLVMAAGSPARGFQLSVFRDEQPVIVAFRVRPETVRHEGELEFVDQWNTRMSVRPDAALSWRVDLDITEPGQYRLVANANATDEASRPVHFGDFNFEVRARSADTELESIRREACYALQEGRHSDAEKAAQSLLKRYPQSSQGYLLLGQIAEAKQDQLARVGDTAAADAQARERKKSYTSALALLTNRADTLYLNNVPTAIVEDQTAALARAIVAP